VGVVLVVGGGFGFWFMFQTIDQRELYLTAATDINRWHIATAADFVAVEANVGIASAMTVDQLPAVVGKWSTGRIPAGTLVTEGLFESPPLSSESEAGKVLIQLSLPEAEAPFGTLSTGDTVALLGVEQPDFLDANLNITGRLELIGVLNLEFVQDGNIYYIVTPQDAFYIRDVVDRFTRSADRLILKLGTGLTANDLVAALATTQGVQP